MKIKVLNRTVEDYKGDGSVTRRFRNADPNLHPLERAREYQRALNAVKLERIMAKPFVKALDGHEDSVNCMAIARKAAAPLISGSCNGELKVWNLQHFECRTSIKSAHSGFVRDVTVNAFSDKVVSCGDDKQCKLWSLNPELGVLDETPAMCYHTASVVTSLDHHWSKPVFVTASDTVDVWDLNRSTPLSSFEWGCERVIATRFNPAEPALVASTAVDRSIGLYDLRGNTPIRKVILKMRSNAVAWNPMNPLTFTVANEDCNLYTFDMRKLDAARGRHWDHVMAVLDVAYSPTGQEFVSASYDKTIRIWNVDEQRSRDVYHTKRMQRVLCCEYSPDSRFVFSGSEDTNIRIWKNKSDMKLGTLDEAEKRAVAYREKLKTKFGRLSEVKRIARHKHVPKTIKSLTSKRQIMRESRTKKDANRIKHSKPGKAKKVPAKKKNIIKQLA